MPSVRGRWEACRASSVERRGVKFGAVRVGMEGCRVVEWEGGSSAVMRAVMRARSVGVRSLSMSIILVEDGEK